MTEYKQGIEARKRFEGTMKALFQAPKPAKGKATKSSKAASAKKQKSSDKD